MKGTEYFLQDPFADDRLYQIPEAISDVIEQVMDALIAQGRRPSPEVVQAALAHRGLAPPDPDVLAVVLATRWWVLLDEIAWNEPAVLQRYLDLAPVRHHPGYYHVHGLLAGITAVKCFGY